MSKKITMTDIAKEVGVSQTLVSFVLSGKNDMGISTDTKTKVLNTARRLGYCSNAASQMLKLGRSGCIVLCFTDWCTFEYVDFLIIDIDEEKPSRFRDGLFYRCMRLCLFDLV